MNIQNLNFYLKTIEIKQIFHIFNSIKNLKLSQNHLDYLNNYIFTKKTYIKTYLYDIFIDFLKLYKIFYNISTYDLLLSGFCNNRTVLQAHH